MHIRKPKPNQLSERDVTPEDIYRSRRRFLRNAALGLGGIGLAAAGLKEPLSSALWGREPLSPGATPADKPLAPLKATRNPKYTVPGRNISPESVVAGYNNYYEFLTDKRRVAENAANFQPRPWQIEIKGLVEKPLKLDVDDLLKRFPLEERIYRHRCVEAWSIVVPWIGFPMARFVEWAKPTAKAKFIRMVSFYRPEQCIGQREQTWYRWPYYEGLRMDEAMNEIAFLVVGSYGHVLPNANGSPIRLATPWKYGYKSIKGIVTFEFTDKQPHTFWNDLVPDEYDFLSNVNPAKPHPRWSQATETEVATGQRIPTLPLNGYAEYVAGLYR
jgi:sulfoxide reductase catalytic subunit YedY